MAITLEKGQGLTLEKSQNNLSLVTIGLGWDIAEQKKGLLGGLFGGQPAEYDLDVVAFLCDASGKVPFRKGHTPRPATGQGERSAQTLAISYRHNLMQDLLVAMRPDSFSTCSVVSSACSTGSLQSCSRSVS